MSMKPLQSLFDHMARQDAPQVRSLRQPSLQQDVRDRELKKKRETEATSEPLAWILRAERAIKQGHLRQLQHALSRGASPNAMTPAGQRLMTLAAERGFWAGLDVLHRKGGDPLMMNSQGETTLGVLWKNSLPPVTQDLKEVRGLTPYQTMATLWLDRFQHFHQAHHPRAFLSGRAIQSLPSSTRQVWDQKRPWQSFEQTNADRIDRQRDMTHIVDVSSLLRIHAARRAKLRRMDAEHPTLLQAHQRPHLP